MLASVVITSINHVLLSENWACRRLQLHSGKTINIQISPMMTLNLSIDADGKVQSSIDSAHSADVTLALPLLFMPRLIARDPSTFESITISGDQVLADELISIAMQVNPSTILEHDLSKTVGDISAHRIVQAGEHLVRWQVENVDHLSQALAEYCTEENDFLTKPSAVVRFAQEVQNLQLDADRLEQRLDQLSRPSHRSI